MYDATATLVGMSGFIFGKQVSAAKERKESHEEFDERTWKEKIRVNDEGFIYMPGIALKACLCSTAKYAGMKIPGGRQRTYTQPFTRGLQCFEPILFDKKIGDIELMRLPVIAEPGSTKETRVPRIFPYLPEWTAKVRVRILDEIINTEVLAEHFNLSGIMTGMGTWRPERGREYGTYRVMDFKTEEI